MCLISIIIPVLNEEKYLESCLDSILNSDYPKDKMEVIVVDGGSSDLTLSILDSYLTKYSFIKKIHNPKKIVPISMNLGIKESKGDFIIRLDAHSSYPVNYFSGLIKGALTHQTDNIGGICITDVKNKDKKSVAIKTVLGHRFGVGNSLFRTGFSGVLEVDTVPFGCFRRDVFDKFGYYDERLVRNQDIELNKRIKNGGGKILLDSKISCIYYARENFRSLMKNNYKNGLWNVLTVFYTKNIRSLSLRHFIPMLFVLSLILPLIIGFFIPKFYLISIGSFLTYSFCIMFFSLTVSQKEHNSKVCLFLSFLFLHLSYGFGSMIAVLKLPFTR